MRDGSRLSIWHSWTWERDSSHKESWVLPGFNGPWLEHQWQLEMMNHVKKATRMERILLNHIYYQKVILQSSKYLVIPIRNTVATSTRSPDLPELPPFWRHPALNPSLALAFSPFRRCLLFHPLRHVLTPKHTFALGDELTLVAQIAWKVSSSGASRSQAIEIKGPAPVSLTYLPFFILTARYHLAHHVGR
jgi:hypothetical protein